MLIAFLNTLFGKTLDWVLSLIKKVEHAKFYFIGVLLFLCTLGFIYREAVTITVQDIVYNQIRFRDCRDILGLHAALDKMIEKDSLVTTYSVYLYQPVNNAFYKKIVVTNSQDVLHSPSLQGMYLKNQPLLNQKLREDSYYMLDETEARRHGELQYLIDLDPHPGLFYALKLNGEVIGEILVKFKRYPTPQELGVVLQDLSPLLYNYIM